MGDKEELIINELSPPVVGQQFSNLIPRTGNGLTIKPFRFLENYSDQNSDQVLAVLRKYKKPVLRKGKRWWIEYHYRVPPELSHVYSGKQWAKFRVFEDINREGTSAYALLLLDAVELGLKNGFDPFEHQKQVKAELEAGMAGRKKWTIAQGLSRFIQAWEDRGNEKDTVRNYSRVVGLLQEWLVIRGLQNLPLRRIQSEWVEQCLKEAQQKQGWTNRTYNNNLNLIRTCFNYLVKKELLSRSPGAGIDRKKAKSEKHRYYDPVRFALIRRLMQEKDPMLFFAAKLVYYLCIRSVKELRNLRIGDIYIDRRQVLVRAEVAKTDSDRYVSIPDDLLGELTDMVNQHPSNYYVIGAWHQGNKLLPENRPSDKPFGKNFLTDRFAVIRREAKLDSRYTLYSLKHTRIIHLKQDGGKDHDIIALTGHTTFEAYAGYLRDLGIDGDAAAINKITRKF